MRLPDLQGVNPYSLFKRAVVQFLMHDMQTHARAVTYQVLFSFFPFIIFFMALLGYFDLSNLFDWLRSQSEVFFLPQTATQMNTVMDQLQHRRHGMLSFGFIFSIWASSSAMRATMKALNVIYGVKEKRPAWKRYGLSVLMTLLVGTTLAAAVTLLLVRPAAMLKLIEYFGVSAMLSHLWIWWLRWPAIVLLLTASVTVVYWNAPDVEQRFRFVAPGAFVTVLVWCAISLAFDLYVRNIARFDQLYGSVGTAVVLLLYFFISALILLFGAEFNAAAEFHSPEGKNAGEKTMN